MSWFNEWLSVEETKWREVITEEQRRQLAACKAHAGHVNPAGLRVHSCRLRSRGYPIFTRLALLNYTYASLSLWESSSSPSFCILFPLTPCSTSATRLSMNS